MNTMFLLFDCRIWSSESFA